MICVSSNDKAIAALAYAMYDADNTGRLSQDIDAQAEYFERAQKLLQAITTHQTDRERMSLAAAIRLFRAAGTPPACPTLILAGIARRILQSHSRAVQGAIHPPLWLGSFRGLKALRGAKC